METIDTVNASLIVTDAHSVDGAFVARVYATLRNYPTRFCTTTRAKTSHVEQRSPVTLSRMRCGTKYDRFRLVAPSFDNVALRRGLRCDL
ncbi:hypothetical protein Y032_0127g1372 [Ancylostoma ceylanicum]|uniref:Uncharacterized protein n=1 Tax=Ancylostoma ceylanicum TaxID=53326 RepID=A0A016T858_9BILA|nr:hypothetical protein Y032_0127g1372 [Ancylostoma ceylanicum]